MKWLGFVLALAVAVPAGAAVPGGVAGPDGRAALVGGWSFRADPGDGGIAAGWAGPGATAGFTAVDVPHAFDAEGRTRQQYLGSVGWYRRELALAPAGPGERVYLRFESVAHRATVWVNGIELARHEGAWLPWEVDVTSALRADGRNELVVRADSRRDVGDVPPLERRAGRKLIGGWWNYGGLLRTVAVRRIDRVDVAAVEVVGDRDPVQVRATLQSVTAEPQLVEVTVRGASVRPTTLAVVRLEPGQRRTVSAPVTLTDARRWSPSSPVLHDLEVRVTPVSGLGALERPRPLATYRTRFGLRRLQVAGGRLLLDGAPLAWRGVGLHEDAPGRGGALLPADEEALLQRARSIGATLIRTHYPLSPTLLDRADELGLLVWSEAPVYRLKESQLAGDDVRARALATVGTMVTTQRHHPSVLVWSVGNELPSQPGPAQTRYLAEAAALVRARDDSRPVGLAIGLPGSRRCHAAYAPLDLLGVNEYWGWYRYRTERLGERLDVLRACYPGQAIAVTEFGAEANRRGPVTRKGTYAFQARWTAQHLAVHATKPWLAGTTYWALQDFLIRPDWHGGNPRPTPPFHHKGLFSRHGVPKPAARVVQRAFAP